jgi:hypothetical protein
MHAWGRMVALGDCNHGPRKRRIQLNKRHNNKISPD